MIDRGRHSVLGVGVNAVDYEYAVDRVMEAARNQQPLAVSALAVHGVMTGATDPEHRYRLNRFDIICPDGQPVRWALGVVHGAKLADRVYGPTLMLKVCERAAQDGVPIFLFGGSPELLETLSKRLLEKFPALQIAGMQASRFRQTTPEEKDETAKRIRESGARIVFVGLGCPRQEVWTYENREAVSLPMLAVGAAFNFHAGLLPQAPPRLQKLGLEWFYRLVQEPKRLWRRYLLLNPLYLSMLFLQWTGLRRYDTEDAEPPKQQLLYG